MLVDGGPKSAGDDVVAFLKSQNIKVIDYVVATHPDADHIGGLIDVFAAFKVNDFVNSGKVHTTETYEELLTAAANEGSTYIEPTVGQFIDLDPALQVQVLHVNSEAEECNDSSIVLKVTYNKLTFLLTSDADTNIESQIASKFNVQSAILKAGHHGSDTSTSLSFLQKVKPSVTILSYGNDNSYGHPVDDVVSSLRSVNSRIYSTAQSGTITITTDGSSYTVWAVEYRGSGNPSKSFDDQDTGTDIIPNVPTETDVIPNAPTTFKNCTEMRVYYPNGVSSEHPAYDKKHDRDGDLWACEK